MPVDHGRDLEPKLKTLNDAFARLANDGSLEELVEIIHRPGWTTPAEVAFFTGIVDSMIAQAEVLTALRNVLLTAGSKVELNPQPLPP
jgi:hypothetical protein